MSFCISIYYEFVIPHHRHYLLQGNADATAETEGIYLEVVGCSIGIEKPCRIEDRCIWVQALILMYFVEVGYDCGAFGYEVTVIHIIF